MRTINYCLWKLILRALNKSFDMSNELIDCVVIGGGIVGLAIAKKFAKVRSVALIEKEASLMSDTSSRNSEVIHSGIYYENKSLKKRLCLEGKEELYTYCRKKASLTIKLEKLLLEQKLKKIRLMSFITMD